jgi:hypothetical protein
VSYRRKPTRPPRQIEQDERDQLKAELERLARRNHDLLKIVSEKEHAIDLLTDQKLRLAMELRNARGHIAFLQGQELYCSFS